MRNTWIVGIDGSPDSSAALHWAAAFAHERDGDAVQPVLTWHVPLPIWATQGRRSVEVDHLGLEAIAAHTAEEAVQGLGANGVTVGPPKVVEGHPGHALLEMSGSDTPLVVGRRGIGQLRHRLLGSVSSYLATHADGPVVVVPDEWTPRPTRRIVVGFDGSEHAGDALRWALDTAPEETAVEALIAVDVIPWLKPEVVRERHPDLVESAIERLTEAVDEVDPEHRASRVFELHGPRQALSAACVDADLVVVGPRGIGAMARVLLGSVTTWLLNDAPCPIAVIHAA